MSQIELQPGFDFQKAGKDVLEIEREGLAQLDQYINQDFSLACEKIFYCAGKVVVMGMGKSGHIGRKMAATFASTGTSSFFVHPGEAAHGDLGMVTPQDIVIALSNSGESNEILALIPVLKRLQVPLICMTSRPESSMARAADIHLCVKVPKEACPLGLAPTSSTTALARWRAKCSSPIAVVTSKKVSPRFPAACWSASNSATAGRTTSVRAISSSGVASTPSIRLITLALVAPACRARASARFLRAASTSFV